jgi:F-type H+-transporting ATPase subunit alpha
MLGFDIDPRAITAILEDNLRKYSDDLGINEVGHVMEAGDGIALVDGLPGCMSEEMLRFANGVYGMAMNLERRHVGTIVFGDYAGIHQGDQVQRTGKVLQVPVGDALLGRVVDALGRPLDGRGPILTTEYRLVETDAPAIIDREPVHRPLHTGLKSIDAMTAIGRGQRELIVGDRQTGKTTLAVDAILNQAPGDVRCIYVAIGQKLSTVAQVVHLLHERNVMDNCIVVVAGASDSAPLQYIAPFAACAMAEYFRDKGGDALIVYDDLSKHAVAYRQISLVLRRPAGREAYPGDIFYLHSRLLERAAKLSVVRGGGSLTALPIVETQQGDYSAYIPTNLISITDGQIYLENDLFYQGFRPAINVGLSVSRVGGKAQTRAMKKVAIRLRIEFAQYRELAAFARLTADLDKTTLDQLRRGERIAEILKQSQNQPLALDQQVAVLWSALMGHLDDVPLHAVRRFQDEWCRYLATAAPAIGEAIRKSEDLTPATETQLDAAMTQFKRLFSGGGKG